MVVEEAEKRLQIADYVVFALTLAISLGIGLYHAFTGDRQRTTKDFLMGNRQLRTLPVALSMLVSFISAVLVLGTPAEMYTRGTLLFMRSIGYGFACLISSCLFVELFHRLNITSSFEYLEHRYNSRLCRLVAMISMLIGSILYMGICMYTPSTALEAVTGFPLWASILASGLIATIYTTLGGMRAVIWTDVFQAGVMIAGMLAIVIQGSIEVGGFTKIWNLNKAGGRLIFFDFNVDPTQRLSIWSTVIGGMISAIGTFGCGQASVQRYCALPTLRQAKMTLLLNIPFLLIVNILAALVGLTVYAYYADLGCDPLKQGYISNSNQLVPYFVLDVLNYPGVNGIFLAVLFSGALSSLSSSMNSAAAVTWEDLLKRFLHHISEDKKALITKLLVIMYGGIAMVLAYLANNLGGHVLQLSLSVSGATVGPSLGMFLLGALFPCANAIGAFVGAVLSSALMLWLIIGANLNSNRTPTLPTSTANCSVLNATSYFEIDSYESRGLTYDFSMTFSPPEETNPIGVLNKFYSVSFLWYATIGSFATIIFGLIISLLNGEVI
ncbi:hypothetical protein CAPTEDRAFT_112687 [Capitella teleta]|uniref:Sodium-coupled monocarboxylate transporter 1 n=1 Tax=Capitella teleta TaxID=283909 RepID=R7V5Y3_CAPTE|nr:hypothetical protein CAPTEDRAFT_112687 [Capitella teleta]|eukprot:ELU11741.1 hypothetical protein CAPTEDRAFT_112687 [Capitella teleta]